MQPVSQYIMSIVVAVSRHRKLNPGANENQLKASLTAMKAERDAFALLARIWLVAPKC